MKKSGEIVTHYTCTSTNLDSTPGSEPEHINRDVLDRLHKRQTGTPVSSNPAVAIIQREQAIARHKRGDKGKR